MVWAKRLLAVVAAAGLIVAALVIRNKVIEDDDSGTRDPDAASTLVCVTELRALCDAAGAAVPGLRIRVEPAARTASAWASTRERPDEAWLTLAPLPDLVATERARARLADLALDSELVGSSPLVVAVPNAKATALSGACGAPLDWRCVSDLAGNPWAGIDGPGNGTIKPAFGPLDSAVGQLGVTQAVRGYFGDAPVDPGDIGLITWVRSLANAVNATALSGGTPIGTVQVRDSAVDVAVGIDAEITNAGRDKLTTLYAAPMTRVDLVLATPDGVGVSATLTDAIISAAESAAWQPGTSAEGEPLTAEQVAQATRLWRDNS